MNGIQVHNLADVQSSNIGNGTRIWQYTVVLPEAVIGKDCNLCAQVFIENNVRIGDHVTIKNGVQIWDGIVIEDFVFIGPNVTFTNDLYPRSKHYPDGFTGTLLKKGASIGANATILAGITVGAYSMIGAGSLISKDVPDYTLWYGNPAKHMGYVTETGECLGPDLKSKDGLKQYKLSRGRPVMIE